MLTISYSLFSTGFGFWLRYCSDVAQRKSTKLCTMFGRLLLWYTVFTFWGLVPPDGISPRAKFTLRPSLAFSCIGSVTARHSSCGRQPNFVALYKEWNYGTLADGATYIRMGGHHTGHWPTFLVATVVILCRSLKYLHVHVHLGEKTVHLILCATYIQNTKQSVGITCMEHQSLYSQSAVCCLTVQPLLQ